MPSGFAIGIIQNSKYSLNLWESTSQESKKLIKPWIIKLECVSPECYLPKITTVGLNGFFFLS